MIRRQGFKKKYADISMHLGCIDLLFRLNHNLNIVELSESKLNRTRNKLKGEGISSDIDNSFNYRYWSQCFAGVKKKQPFPYILPCQSLKNKTVHKWESMSGEKCLLTADLMWDNISPLTFETNKSIFNEGAVCRQCILWDELSSTWLSGQATWAPTTSAVPHFPHSCSFLFSY